MARVDHLLGIVLCFVWQVGCATAGKVNPHDVPYPQPVAVCDTHCEWVGRHVDRFFIWTAESKNTHFIQSKTGVGLSVVEKSDGVNFKIDPIIKIIKIPNNLTSDRWSIILKDNLKIPQGCVFKELPFGGYAADPNRRVYVIELIGSLKEKIEKPIARNELPCGPYGAQVEGADGWYRFLQLSDAPDRLILVFEDPTLGRPYVDIETISLAK